MRILEALTWFLVILGIVSWSIPPLSRRTPLVFAATALTVALAQAFVEGARVHLIPIYVLLGALGVLTWWRPRPRWRAVVAVPLSVIAAGALALPSMFPVFAYDTPDGPFGVGTTTYAAPDPAGDHDLAIQVWYPTEPGVDGPRAGISPRPDLLAASYSELTGLPAALFDHLRLVKTHAVVDAPLAATRTRFPVVLFSHGPISANRSQSIFQLEQLASHGFVTLAIDHTGYSSLVVFPDGRVEGVMRDAAWPVFANAASQALVERWTLDARRAIDFVDLLDSGDARFAGRLDRARIGYVGASFGGSVAMQAAVEDPRIKAVVAEDGKPYFFDATPAALRTPVLYLQSALPYIPVPDAQLAAWGVTRAEFEAARDDHYARLATLLATVTAPFYDVLVGGTNHVTFSDLHLLLRFPDSQLEDPRRARRVINAYTLAFLDRYLNGVASPLVDGHSAAPFDEVTVTARNVPATRSVGTL